MERGQTAAESRRRDGPGNKDASRRWGWAHLEGTISLSVDDRSGPVVRRWTDRGIYLIQGGGGGLRFCECAANQHHRMCDEADPAGWFGSCCGVSGADSGQRIMVRNIPDDTVLSPRFLLLSPSIIRRVPCVDPVLLEVPSHEESFPHHCSWLKRQALAFPDTSRDNLDCQRLLWTMMWSIYMDMLHWYWTDLLSGIRWSGTQTTGPFTD